MTLPAGSTAPVGCPSGAACRKPHRLACRCANRSTSVGPPPPLAVAGSRRQVRKGGESNESCDKAADSLLSVIVPRAIADAWTCPNGCHRIKCFCLGGHDRRHLPPCGRHLVVSCLDRTRQIVEGAHDVTDSGSLADPRSQAALQ